jgi:VanZ family protein
MVDLRRFERYFGHTLSMLPIDIQSRLVRLSRFFCAGVFILITVMSLIPEGARGSATDIERYGLDDKVAHILAYGALMGTAMWAHITRVHRLKAFLFFLAYGALMEIGQVLMTEEREGSLTDALANAAGLVLGVGLGVWFATLLNKRFSH